MKIISLHTGVWELKQKGTRLGGTAEKSGPSHLPEGVAAHVATLEDIWLLLTDFKQS